MYESSGSEASWVQTSPAVRHSVADAQNCSGAAAGHGPTWQLATRFCVAQQTKPTGQSPALEHAAPPGFPLLDPSLCTPELPDAPEPPLEADEPP